MDIQFGLSYFFDVPCDTACIDGIKKLIINALSNHELPNITGWKLAPCAMISCSVLNWYRNVSLLSIQISTAKFTIIGIQRYVLRKGV